MFIIKVSYVQVLSEEKGRMREEMRVRGLRKRQNMNKWRKLGNIEGKMVVRQIERDERGDEEMR